jgi:hypothetical protein
MGVVEDEQPAAVGFAAPQCVAHGRDEAVDSRRGRRFQAKSQASSASDPRTDGNWPGVQGLGGVRKDGYRD